MVASADDLGGKSASRSVAYPGGSLALVNGNHLCRQVLGCKADSTECISSIHPTNRPNWYLNDTSFCSCPLTVVGPSGSVLVTSCIGFTLGVRSGQLPGVV